MNNKIVIIMSVISLAAIGYLIYILYHHNNLIVHSSSSSQSPSPATPTPSTTPSPSPTPTPTQPFVVNTYSVNNTNVLIPLLSEDFVISIKPLSDQVSVMAWFNIENDVQQHGDSLIVNNNPITITQETPIIYSDVLKSQNVPYNGYPYLVIAVAGFAEIKASFYVW